MNTYISQSILFIHMQPKQNTPISGEDDNALQNFGPYEDKKSTLKKQNIERDHTNLVDKSLNNESHAKDSLSRRIPQDGLFASELSSF